MGKIYINMCECFGNKEVGMPFEVYETYYPFKKGKLYFITRREGLVSDSDVVIKSNIKHNKKIKEWSRIVSEEIFRLCVVLGSSDVVLLGRGRYIEFIKKYCISKGIKISTPIMGMSKEVAIRFVESMQEV